MDIERETGNLSWGLLLACLCCLSPVEARPETDECISLGALAYDNWTSLDGGGSGLPAGEPMVDYLRCTSCHGWDRLGEFGAYVRRVRTAEQPNAGLGDLNTVSRNISPGLGNFFQVSLAQVLHAGTGRAYVDGSGSWVPLDPEPTPDNVADHAEGFTLGNLHPDFSSSGVNGGDIVLTQDQAECLVEFINNADSDPQFYFQDIDQYQEPVVYTINSNAHPAAGQAYYDVNCRDCHGDPASDFQGNNNGEPEGGILAFLRRDGAYSEFAHKARWGIPESVMTRERIGMPDAQDTIDLMKYLQGLQGESFVISAGIGGTWWNPDRDGEGFLIDVADGGVFVATFYTYDNEGRQFWLIGDGQVLGDSASVTLHATDGGVFGSQFDPEAVNRHYWGMATFTFAGCQSGVVDLAPEGDYASSFEPMNIDIERLTDPVGCESG